MANRTLQTLSSLCDAVSAASIIHNDLRSPVFAEIAQGKRNLSATINIPGGYWTSRNQLYFHNRNYTERQKRMKALLHAQYLRNRHGIAYTCVEARSEDSYVIHTYHSYKPLCCAVCGNVIPFVGNERVDWTCRHCGTENPQLV